MDDQNFKHESGRNRPLLWFFSSPSTSRRRRHPHEPSCWGTPSPRRIRRRSDQPGRRCRCKRLGGCSWQGGRRPPGDRIPDGGAHLLSPRAAFSPVAFGGAPSPGRSRTAPRRHRRTPPPAAGSAPPPRAPVHSPFDPCGRRRLFFPFLLVKGPSSLRAPPSEQIFSPFGLAVKKLRRSLSPTLPAGRGGGWWKQFSRLAHSHFWRRTPLRPAPVLSPAVTLLLPPPSLLRLPSRERGRQTDRCPSKPGFLPTHTTKNQGFQRAGSAHPPRPEVLLDKWAHLTTPDGASSNGWQRGPGSVSPPGPYDAADEWYDRKKVTKLRVCIVFIS